jgi:DNA-binding response OmpR family regulator
MTPSRILVIEDEPAIAENLAALLSAKGHRVDTAADGARGIELARKTAFNLILLDVMLPRMSGLDVCKLLRADAKTREMKIIMVTGLDRMNDVEEAFRAGADDYLIKPFDSQRLFKKIEKVLGAP